MWPSYPSFPVFSHSFFLSTTVRPHSQHHAPGKYTRRRPKISKDSLTKLDHARERKEDSYEVGNFHPMESFTENTEVQQTARTCTHVQHSTSDAGSVASYLNDKVSLPFPPKKRYFLTFQAVLYFDPLFLPTEAICALWVAEIPPHPFLSRKAQTWLYHYH